MEGLTQGVHILALVNHPKEGRGVVLIEQYRPPVGATVVGELPTARVS